MSLGVTSDTGVEPSGLQRAFARSHWPRLSRPFHDFCRFLMTWSKASSTVGTAGGGFRMSSPPSTRLALSRTLDLAMARVTAGNEPSPSVVSFPPILKRCDQVLDHRPLAVFLTSRLSPRPPRPSP